MHSDQDVQLGQCTGTNINRDRQKLCQNKLCGQNQDYAFKKLYTFLWNTYLQVILVGNKCDMEDERVSSKKKNYDDNDDAKHVKIRYRFGYKSIIDDNDIDR